MGQAAFVQRWSRLEKRNILEHIPEKERSAVSRKLNQAWRETEYGKAPRTLQKLADDLEDRYPGAAASLREGLDEMLRDPSRTTWAVNEDATVDQLH